MWLPLVCPLLETWPATQTYALTGNQTSDPLVPSPRSIHWATPAREGATCFYFVLTFANYLDDPYIQWIGWATPKVNTVAAAAFKYYSMDCYSLSVCSHITECFLPVLQWRTTGYTRPLCPTWPAFMIKNWAQWGKFWFFCIPL